MKIQYNEFTETFRAMPSNVWIASVKNKKLVFDSWDGLAKDYYKNDIFLRTKVIAHYIKLRITKAL